MAEVWAAFLPDIYSGLPADMPALRLQRCQRLQREQDLRHAAASHLLLQRALDSFAGRKISLASWVEAETGKPYLEAEPGLHFSLAHTGKLVLVGVDNAPLGVDAEALRSVNPALLRKIAHPSESAVLEVGTCTDKALLSLWTRKESYGKYLGIGVFQQKIQNTPLLGQKVPEGGCIGNLPLPEGYVGAVCCAPPLPDIVHWVTL